MAKRGQNRRERSGETETWQPTKKEREMGTTKYRDRRDMGETARKGGGNRRKATTAKRKRRKSRKSLSKDPAWKTGGEWVGEKKKDGK